MKLGRLAPVHNLYTMRSALRLVAALDDLGTPPPISTDYVSAVDAVTGGDWAFSATTWPWIARLLTAATK
jgi:hypothetical protein